MNAFIVHVVVASKILAIIDWVACVDHGHKEKVHCILVKHVYYHRNWGNPT